MFEGALNGLLTQFLAPYVDGLTSDKLRLSFGVLELKELRLKPSLFATLGIDTVDVECGEIHKIYIELPLSALISGRIHVALEGFRLVAKTRGADGKSGAVAGSDSEQLETLRRNIRQRVKTRVAQLCELKRNQKLVEVAKAAGSQVKDKVSLAVKVTRQLLANVSVAISGISTTLHDPVNKSMFCFHLGSAFVRAPPGLSQAALDDAAAHGRLCKEAAIESLSLEGGRFPCPGALLAPQNFVIRFNHDPEAGMLSAQFEFGSTSDKGVSLSEEQLCMIARTALGLSREARRLRALLTPPGTEELVDLRSSGAVDRTQQEFVDLLQRELREELDLVGEVAPLEDTDRWRLQVLRDVVPEELQSRWWIPVAEQVEAVEKKRSRERERKSVWLSRWYTTQDLEENELRHAAAFQDLRAQAEQLSSLEPPKKISLEFVVVQFAFELNGRGEDENILRVAMAGSSVKVDAQQQMDCRGVPSANVTLDLTLHRMNMTHLQENVIEFGSADKTNPELLHELVPLPAVGLRLQNRLEKSQNIMHFSLNLQPVDVFLVRTLVPRLLEFQQTAKSAFSEAEEVVATRRKSLSQAADKALDAYFTRGEEWLKSDQGQNVLSQARERVPDACELQISLHGPRVQMPIPNFGSLHVSSGTLVVQTPRACTMAGIRLTIRLSEAAVSVEDATDHRHDVLSPAKFDIQLLVEQGAIDVDMHLDNVQMKVSPGVAQILLAAPGSLAESFSAPHLATASKEQHQEELADARALETVVQSRGAADDADTGGTSANVGITGESAAGLAKTSSALASRANTYLAIARERAKRVEVPRDQKFRACFNLESLNLLLLRDCDITPGVLRLDTSVRSFRLSYTDGILEVPVHAPSGSYWPLADLRTSPDAASVENNGQNLRQSLHLSVDVFNIRTGRFEPLLEPFELTCELSLDQHTRSGRFFGQRPLLLDVTPSSLRLCSWYFPVFLAALSPPPRVEAVDSEDVPRSPTSAPSFMVFNLTQENFTFKFPEASGQQPLNISPTGKKSMDITDWVVTTRCNHIFISSQYREVEFALDQLNAVMLSKDGAMPVLAQLLRPRMEGALLLISSPYQFVNRTSIPIGVRVANSEARLNRANCCPAILLEGGQDEPDEVRRSISGGGSDGMGLLLMRDEVVAAPTADRTLVVQSDGKVDITWEVCPLGGLFAQILEPPSSSPFAAVSVVASGNNFLAVRKMSMSAPPAQFELSTVTLLPPLHLVSVMPRGIDVEYRMATEPASAAKRTPLVSFQENMLYNIPTPGRIAVRVRMEGKKKWSDWAQFAIGSDTEGNAEEAELAINEPFRAEVAVVAQGHGACQIAFSCPAWMIDRTGWDVVVRQHKRQLSDVNGVALCPRGLDGFALDAAGQSGTTFALPAGTSEWATATLHDGRAVCVRSKLLPAAETEPCTVRYLELTPWLVLHNASTKAIEVRMGDEGGLVVAIAPGASVAPQAPPGILRFRPDSAAASACETSPPAPPAWSAAVHAREDSKGAGHFALLASPGDEGSDAGAAEVTMWTAEVRLDQGVLCVVIAEGSSFSVVNKLQESVELRLRGVPPLHVPGDGSSQPIGWLDPLGEDVKRPVELALPSSGETSGVIDPCVAHVTALGAAAEIISSAKGLATSLTVRPRGGADTKKAAPVARLEIVLPKIGLSMIAETEGPTELLYLELDVLRVRASARPEEDAQILDVALSDMQLDWQAADEPEFAVVAGTRGVSQNSLIRPFFRLVAERCRTSSPDLCFPAAKLEMDELEVGANGRVLTQVTSFLKDSIRELEKVSEMALRTDSIILSMVSEQAGISLLEGDWTLPPRRRMLQVGRLHISPIVIHVWCRLRLRSVTFLPKWVKALIATLTLSNALALEGAALKLAQKEMVSATGSTGDFVASLVREYTGDFLSSLGSVLGSSSLLNVPRAPLRLGGAVGCHAAGAISVLTGGAAQAVEFCSLDSEYVERQKAARAAKRIGSFSEGFSSAVSGLGDGLDGVLDIVRKPVAGAKKDGLGGFVKGVGQGVASAVAKPVSAVGGAMSDIGSGVAASAAGVGHHCRLLLKRRRPLRFLAGAFGAVVEYTRLDAEVALAIGSPPQDAIEAIVPLARVQGPRGGGSGGNGSPRGSSCLTEKPEEEGMVLILVLCTASVHVMEIAVPCELPEGEAEAVMLQRLASASLEERAAAGSGRDDDSAPLSVHWSSKFPLTKVSWCQAHKSKLPKALLQAADGHTSFVAAMPWELSPDLAQAVFTVLGDLAEDSRRGDWVAPLRRELSRVRFNVLASSVGDRELSQVCIVWEVQRALAAAGSATRWKRPFLPMESEQKCGWMDTGLKKRHPLLDPDAEPYSELASRDPPVVMMQIWKPCGDWRIVTAEDTDALGWQYGTDWAVSSWGRVPRPIFDTVRRRQWRRRYVLTASTDDDDHAAWLHDAAAEDVSFLDIFFSSVCCFTRPEPKRRATRGVPFSLDLSSRPSTAPS